MPPYQNWLFGHYEDRSIDIDVSLAQLCSDYANPDGVTAMWYFGVPTATVLRYQDARAILQSTPNRMTMPSLIKKQLEMMTGPRNILLLEDKEWKYHRSAIVRSMMSPTTKQNVCKNSIQVSRQLAKTLLKDFEDNNNNDARKQVELNPLMAMLSLDVFGLSAFDFDFKNCKQLKFHPIAQAYQFMKDEYERRMQNPIVGYFFDLPTQANRDYKQCRKTVRDFLSRLVQERQTSVEPRNDLLEHLLRAREELKQGKDSIMPSDADLVDEAMIDTMMTLAFAGHETTALALMYSILELSRNPDVKEQCLKEIDSIMEYGTPAEQQDPTTFKYVEGVVLEALRLHPPLPGMVRTLTRPVKVGQGANAYELPIGSYTYIPFLLVQRDERNFPRPMEFLPERWVEPSTTTSDGKDLRWKDRDTSKPTVNGEIPAGNRHGFFSFSTGGRSCAGQRFAMQEAVLVLANLLHEVEFHWKPGYELHALHSSTGQRPSDNVPILISKRERGLCNR